MNTPANRPVITTFRWVPPFAVGHVRELRVRWALEEAGQPYDIRLIGFEDQDTPAYRQEQPFGQIPVFRDSAGAPPLFESGAILHHIGLRSEALMPLDDDGRAHTLSWMFAALNSVEPHAQNLMELLGAPADAPWVSERREPLEAMMITRLTGVENWLKDRAYLCGRFTVADILMVSQLKLLEKSGLVARFPALTAYQARCIARPAYQRALADHLALYKDAGETA